MAKYDKYAGVDKAFHASILRLIFVTEDKYQVCLGIQSFFDMALLTTAPRIENHSHGQGRLPIGQYVELRKQEF